MAGVAHQEPAAGREKGGDHRGGEGALSGERSEFLVEQADEFFLIQPVHKAPHQNAQIGCRGSYGFAVTRNIREEQPADATGRATRDVVDVAAVLGLAEGFAINPNIETSQFNATGEDLASTPNLHALHMLCGRIGHAGIITARRNLNWFSCLCTWSHLGKAVLATNCSFESRSAPAIFSMLFNRRCGQFRLFF
jgi:hypothetical protein